MASAALIFFLALAQAGCLFRKPVPPLEQAARLRKRAEGLQARGKTWEAVNLHKQADDIERLYRAKMPGKDPRDPERLSFPVERRPE